MLRGLFVSLMCAALLAACGDDGAPTDGGVTADAGVDGGDIGVDASCGTGLVPNGPACAPVLDRCEGNEVPVPGGGCKAVGAEACAGGIQLPGETCTAIGVEECSGGTGGSTGIKQPQDAQCTPVGVAECAGGLEAQDGTCVEVGPPGTCLTGWAKTSKGWCEPVLPGTVCPEGEMAVIGDASCVSMGSCGTTTWGDIQLTAATIHVDQAYTGGDSDGSAAKPFTTVGAALQIAQANAQIAVAAGSYTENLSISLPLKLEGRCAKMVTIEGLSPDKPAIEITAQVELRDLTVKGPQVGVGLGAGGDALLERIAVRGCGDAGVQALAGAKLTAKSCVVADNHRAGVEAVGADASLTATVVRDTLSDSVSGENGTGVVVAWEGTSAATATLVDCLVASNRERGVAIAGADVTIERSVIRDTLPRTVDTTGGGGIHAEPSPWPGAGATLMVRDTVIANNQDPGLSLLGSLALLERVVLRDTQSRQLDGAGGNGIQAIFYGSDPAKLTLRKSLVVGNHNIGVALAGAEATLEQTAVRDTLPQGADNKFGLGIQAGFGLTGEPASTVTLKQCIVAGNRNIGVGLWGAQATLERTVVQGTLSQLSDGKWGTGIKAGTLGTGATDLTLTECVVADNRTVGVAAEGASVKLTVKRSVVRDTLHQLSDKTMGYGIGAYKGPVVAVEQSVVADNRALGIALLGAEGTVDRSVVRGTACELSDKKYGYGIEAAAAGNDPSKVTVTDTLVSGNTSVGIRVEGASAGLERTIVRDTLARAVDGEHGDGVEVLSTAAGAADVTMKDCLVSNNRNAGVILYGASGTIERSIIRDTQPRISDQESGVGLAARAWDQEQATLVVRDSTISNNRSIGVRVCASKATLERTIVQDTLPEAAGLALGYGVSACWIDPDPAELTLKDCIVANNRTLGVGLFSSTARLERTVVRDTLPNAGDNTYGIGIQAAPMPNNPSAPRSELTLLDSQLRDNRCSSVVVASATATIQRCLISKTLRDLSGKPNGDGVNVFTLGGGAAAALHVSDSVVEDSHRAGLIFYTAGGSMHRTVVRKGEHSVILEKGANPTIAKDNLFVDNKEDGVSLDQQLEPPALPAAPEL